MGIDSVKLAQQFSDTSLIQLKNHGASSLEGFLLPDTYEFYWQVDEKEIVRDMLAEFRKFFSDSLQQQARKMKMTIRQVLTMASIVEGETVLDRERPVIAGLYYNRLHRGMKLEADPTIQYIIPDGPRRLLYNDLRIDSPYNTVQKLWASRRGPSTIPEGNPFLPHYILPNIITCTLSPTDLGDIGLRGLSTNI